MKVKRGPIIFHNVIYTTVRGDRIDWRKEAVKLRNTVVKKGFYGTGPVIYQITEDKTEEGVSEATVYFPLNAPVILPEQETGGFQEELLLEDGLLLRHADLEEPLEGSYAILELAAQSQGLRLIKPYYHIYLDVYGGGVIDIFAPVKPDTAD